MTIDPTVQKIAAAIKAARELIADGDLAGLKADVEVFVASLTTAAGPKADGTHYTADDLHALANKTRANLTEVIERSRGSE